MKIKNYLMILLSFLSLTVFAQKELYVATNGSDSNDGSINAPLASLNTARQKARQFKDSEGGVTIYLREGIYPAQNTIYFTKEDSGRPGKPLVISAYPGEKVVFDGGKDIDLNGFVLATNDNELHNDAAGKVFKRVITDAATINALNNFRTALTFNDINMSISRYPNKGFAQINKSTISGESIDKTGDIVNPKGGIFKLYEAANFTKWANEFSRIKVVEARGYLSADWKIENNPISRISPNGEIRLQNGTSYGFANHKIIRISFRKLLCELDKPGEWYFDMYTNELYIYPYGDINSGAKLKCAAGDELINVRNAKYIQFKNFTVSNLGGFSGKPAISIKSNAKHCVIAGVTFKNFDVGVNAIRLEDSYNCRIQSCDFIDINTSIHLVGGEYDRDHITLGYNYVENCHFTQLTSIDFYGTSCTIRGPGNIFRNNLIHNMNGQTSTLGGPETIVEYNEVFNSGVEEGDGGCFYQGASFISQDNTFQNNFIHHIMRIPELIGRAAFFSDDGDAGDIYRNNIFYKGGSEPIKMNQGGGHRVTDNVILETWVGIRQYENGKSSYDKRMDFLLNTPNSGAKDNLIGRMLQAIGEEGWDERLTADNWPNRVSKYWMNRYPNMADMYYSYRDNQSLMPYACEYTGNRFNNVNYKISGGSVGKKEDNIDISMDLFTDPNKLDFSYKSQRPAHMPVINFSKIGLYVDEYRTQIPEKDTYRKTVKEHFDGQPTHTGIKYDYKTVNDRLYFNTGEVVFNSIPESGPTAPIIKFLHPTFGHEYFIGDDIDIEVNATDEGSISKVALYINDSLVSTLNSAPYVWKGSNDFTVLAAMEEGSYILKVIATDNDGNESQVWNRVLVLDPNSVVTGLVNVAIEKPASQSSSHYDTLVDRRGYAREVNDGIVAGIYKADSSWNSTKDELQAWVQVDLKGHYNIHSINVWNRINAAARATNFYLLISNEPFATNILSDALKNHNIHSYHFSKTCGRPTNFEIDAVGRYVRVQLVGKALLHLSEIEVFVDEKDTVPITNIPPTAVISNSRFIDSGDTVYLDGSNSYDFEEDELTYKWTIPEGNTLHNPESTMPFFIAPTVKEETSFEITLTVNDGTSNSKTEVKNFKVLENAAPVIELVSTMLVKEGQKVTLDASNTYDPEEKAMTYNWILPSEISADDITRPTLEFTAPFVENSTNLNIKLVVSDGLLETIDSTVVTVLYNAPPVADFFIETPTVVMGDFIFIDASASNDSDGDNNLLTFKYEVSKEGVQISDAETAYPYFEAPSTPDTTNQYLVTLVVNDGLKDSEPDSAYFTVSNLPLTSGIDDLNANNILVYPNPVRTGYKLTINSDLASSVRVYNSLGRLMSSYNIKDTDLNFTEAGIFFIQILNENCVVIKQEKILVVE